ncbi:MAG: prepilin-type cleavage/methylation domain-containing protein [Polyangiaceae bacterium]|nr:prepilin-type cleavage/methylation domain-containing protein [Polyangiaceae bacterium]
MTRLAGATSRMARPALGAGAPRGGVRGLALVEVLVVIALITLLTGAILYGSGMLAGSRQRAAATLLVSSVRAGITRANATGRPVRLVLDLEAQRVVLEEANGPTMLREKAEGANAGAEAFGEVEAEARAEAERIVKAPRAPRARFSPVRALGFDEQGREIGAGVRLVSVETEHDDEPRVAGRAYVYMWPGGTTERAAIQLRRDGVEEGVTVLVSGLTGRARVERGSVALKRPRPGETGVDEREE